MRGVLLSSEIVNTIKTLYLLMVLIVLETAR